MRRELQSIPRLLASHGFSGSLLHLVINELKKGLKGDLTGHLRNREAAALWLFSDARTDLIAPNQLFNP